MNNKALSLEIITINDENIGRIRDFIAEVRSAEQYSDNIASILFNSKAVVTVYMSKNLAGVLVLFQGDNPHSLYINPGELLGGTPIIKSDKLENEITESLFKESIKWSEWKYQELNFSCDQKMIDDTISKILERQEFEKNYFCLSQRLDNSRDYTVVIPDGFEYKHISKIKRKKLYELFVMASIADKFELVISMTDEQRYDFFEELCVVDIFDGASSIAILKNEKLVAYSYLMKYGESNIHLNYMCVHPDYQKRGLGTFLIKYAQQKTSEAYNTMTLYTDIERPALRLYKKNGFREGGGMVTYRKLLPPSKFLDI